MPSRHYRRILRATTSGATGALKLVIPPVIPKQRDDCEIEILRKYFYFAVDAIIEHMQFANAVETLNGILTSVQPLVDYYKILDQIEHQLLGVVMNIADNVNSELIRLRITHIKSYIEKLPSVCQSSGEISAMIMQVIGILIQNVSVKGIAETVQTIHTYVKARYGMLECVETIQCNLLEIIHAIGHGTPSGIISVRVEFVKGLIDKFSI